MGKNVLKFPGVVLGNPWSLLRLSIVVLATLVGLTSANPEHVTVNLLNQLNMTRIPPKSQWNISQTEYETKHREYFDLVEQNQRRRLNSSANYDEENIVRKKLFTFTHSGLKNSPSPPTGVIHLNYKIHIPEETNKKMEVEETSLRLLIVPMSVQCPSHEQTLTLEAASTKTGIPFKRETFHVADCSPKWIGLDMAPLNAAPKSRYRITIRCRECQQQKFLLEQPHLNVIVNLKARLRRRRAEKKKRRRFPGKCVRHPWEVDLGKLKGYEYIVQPRKFDAGLCAGKCTGQWNLATQHSNLQYLFSNIDKSVPKPCCAPSKMESLEILYPDEDNPKKLKVSVWNDTKIVECACS